MQQTSNVWINTEWTTAAEMKKEQPMHTGRRTQAGKTEAAGQQPAKAQRKRRGGGRNFGRVQARTLSTVAQESSPPAPLPASHSHHSRRAWPPPTSLLAARRWVRAGGAGIEQSQWPSQIRMGQHTLGSIFEMSSRSTTACSATLSSQTGIAPLHSRSQCRDRRRDRPTFLLSPRSFVRIACELSTGAAPRRLLPMRLRPVSALQMPLRQTHGTQRPLASGDEEMQPGAMMARCFPNVPRMPASLVEGAAVARASTS